MKVSMALKVFRDYQQANLKPRTLLGYRYVLTSFEQFFGEKDLSSVSSEDIYHFLEMVTEGNSKSSKRHRYSQLKAFFNFIITNYLTDHKNPLDAQLIRKSFRKAKTRSKRMIPKEMIDEVISMPEQIANRLTTYIREKGLRQEDRLFELSYTSVRTLIKRMGQKLGLELNPHDLRRHSATFASRNGVPLEIISKVLLRHQNLKTTQLYLGKVSDSEAIRWMDILHGD